MCKLSMNYFLIRNKIKRAALPIGSFIFYRCLLTSEIRKRNLVMSVHRSNVLHVHKPIRIAKANKRGKLIRSFCDTLRTLKIFPAKCLQN